MTSNDMMRGAAIHVSGIVQGVGFRPFVYNLALRFGLAGWVRNTSAGVDIAVDGPEERLEAFAAAVRAEAPPLSRIDDFSVAYGPPGGFTGFEILRSEAIADAFQPISPDVCICADCLRELYDSGDRRYLYPFINCTNCGPRFTIIQDIPYDRPKTTMSRFPMCPDCAREYADPTDRRFHAQPVACPVCGPHVWLERPDGNAGQPLRDQDAILETRALLASGRIVAVKGLGGFHLACDATNAAAVGELRRRKLRVDKPFALMMLDIAAVRKHCLVNEDERRLLESVARPIVLLPRRQGSAIAQVVAPGQDWVGVMLPYTPLHYLLLADSLAGEAALPPLVMTSGNLSEEPIATDNDDARTRLASLADAFLMHDRDIHIRCDDSVVRVVEPAADSAPGLPAIYPLRRSRGYAPFPVKLPWQVPSLLATGAELKNTFCITNRDYAFLSHHIGDMENYETLRSFEQGVEHFERLFRVNPEAIAYDLHPNYLASRYAVQRAQRENLEAIGVQHHHAHIAACMAEHSLDGSRRVIGVAFDGTGYGDDGAIWGGEFLIADYL
ncbi:MAG: carbamoyltransferase HypF, partial [Anaerolineae bacterium]